MLVSPRGAEKALCKDILDMDRLVRSSISREEALRDSYALFVRCADLLGSPESLPGLTREERASLRRQTELFREHLRKIDMGYYRSKYALQSAPLLKRYCELLRRPIRVGFAGARQAKKERDLEKTVVESEFLRTARAWLGAGAALAGARGAVYPPPRRAEGLLSQSHVCTPAPEKLPGSSMAVCAECGAVTQDTKNVGSYDDIQRLSVSKRYMYDRKTHFRDTLNQFQANQKTEVPQQVLDSLVREFERCSLVRQGGSRQERFSNITRHHVLRFLRVIKCTKYNEDCTLIWSRITGRAPPDISALEQRLYDDFEHFNRAYEELTDEQRMGRKNMINSHYLLAQLLAKHNYPVGPEEICTIKTQQRLREHDEICGPIFARLGWHFTPMFGRV